MERGRGEIEGEFNQMYFNSVICHCLQFFISNILHHLTSYTNKKKNVFPMLVDPLEDVVENTATQSVTNSAAELLKQGAGRA